MNRRRIFKGIALGLAGAVGFPVWYGAILQAEVGEGLKSPRVVSCFAPAALHAAGVGMSLRESAEADIPPPPPPPGVPGGVPGGVMGGVVGGNATLSESKLIKKGEVTLEVADVAPAREEAIRRVQAVHGWVSEQEESRDPDGHLTATLHLRIPADAFDAGHQSLRSLGTVTREHLETEDVSREWVDREARLQVKRAAAIRLKQLLLQRTAGLKDLLEAERALVRVTEEIESMESIHRHQARQVAYATLELQLVGPHAPIVRSSFGPLTRFGDQVTTRLSASLAVLVLFFTALLPWGLLAWGGWALRRRLSRPPLAEVPDGRSPL
ncbi:MAG TPA: DUF4349 domain-containing protein [Holophagaceae bacterium]|nr:DUF4349 domain-containing protein [Holophagaceae bacterium]